MLLELNLGRSQAGLEGILCAVIGIIQAGFDTEGPDAYFSEWEVVGNDCIEAASAVFKVAGIAGVQIACANFNLCKCGGADELRGDDSNKLLHFLKVL